MGIRYLQNHEINTKAWDRCIAGSLNGNIYGCSWYLDLVCKRWDALVEDDYLSVMPLPVDQCLGRKIISSPEFVNDLGIYSIKPVDANKTAGYIHALPDSFYHCRILLNKLNPLEGEEFPFQIRKRFELDLIKPYHKIVEGFDPELRNRLNLAMAHQLTFLQGISTNDLIRFIRDNRIPLKKAVIRDDFRLLRMLIAGLIRYKSGNLFGVYNRYNNLASAGMFAWFNNRIEVLLLITAPDQLHEFPHLFLLDRFIDKYSETNITLNFEPVHKGHILLPYRHLGAIESQLTEINLDQLPFYLKMLFRLLNC
jgi:hypothetical protein